MMPYDPYFEPISLATQNSQQPKKYSLRRKYQNPLREQLDQSKTIKYDHLSSFAANNQRAKANEMPAKEEQPRTIEEKSNFNCIDSAQRILDFNQTTSISIKNHTKTLSTTPSFQNPFIYTHKPRQDARKSQQVFKKTLTKKSLVSSKEELHPSKTKSQKTAVSHKISNNSSKNNVVERLYTENNSQPLSTVNYDGLYEQEGALQKKGKVSLKHPSKFNLQSKSQLLICLKYSDLKEPIRSIRFANPHNTSITDIPIKAQEGHGLEKFFCSNNFKGRKDGCQCQPKCVWMDKWINFIGESELRYPEMQMTASEWEGTIRQIEKDLPRTQPDNPTFQNTQYLATLREVLICYAKLDREVGYVQGMNFIAAALVYHARNAFETLKVMDHLMRCCGFRKILLKDLAMSHLVSQRCMYELKRLAFDLYTHFISEQVQVELFITSWYFSLLGNFVPLESMHLVLDKFLRRQFAGLNELVITLLLRLKDSLMSLHDSHLMMAFSNQQLTLSAAKIDWADLVARSDHLVLQPLLY